MVKQVISSVLTVSLYCLMPVAMAADETMDSSVYLVFDPATGQFVSKTKVLSESNQTIDTGVEQGQPFAMQSETATTPDTVPGTEAAQVSTETVQPAAATSALTPDTSSSARSGFETRALIGAFIVLAVIGGFLIRRRGSRSEMARN